MFGHPSGITLLIFGVLYFIPAILANRRHHPSAGAIAALNFFLGWTGLGWIAAFVWSLTNPAPKPSAYVVVQGTAVQSSGDKHV